MLASRGNGDLAVWLHCGCSSSLGVDRKAVGTGEEDGQQHCARLEDGGV